MFKRAWEYIKAHPVHNRVAAGFIQIILGTVFLVVVIAIWPSAPNINYSEKVRQFFSISIAMWVFILCVLTAIICTSVIVARRKTVRNENNSIPIIDPDVDFSVPLNLVFDSNLTNQGWYDGYGVQYYSEEKGNYGKRETVIGTSGTKY